LTLQGAGLFHIAMGAVLGLAAYGRTQEKLAGANNGGLGAGTTYTPPAPTPATGGFGNHVIINHGYGYETVYGHMVKIKVSTGQKINRGEVIGWVGSTGKSTGPHCHYEVHINGNEVDPVYFFYSDLNAEQYDRLLKLASSGSAKSFD
jgi:murein DD-endopeptidase MepM/ murein hydrolase activator NlpD